MHKNKTSLWLAMGIVLFSAVATVWFKPVDSRTPEALATEPIERIRDQEDKDVVLVEPTRPLDDVPAKELSRIPATSERPERLLPSAEAVIGTLTLPRQFSPSERMALYEKNVKLRAELHKITKDPRKMREIRASLNESQREAFERLIDGTDVR